MNFDNAVHVAESPRPRLLVLFAGQDVETKPDGLLYFLKGALGETPREEIEVRRVDPAQPIPEVDLHAAHLLVLGREPGPAALAAARRFAEGGKIALLPITGATTAAEVGALLGTPVAALSEAKVREYAMLAEIDLRIRSSRLRRSALQRFHEDPFLEASALDPPRSKARVLARFDSGDPAMVEVPIGKGRAVLLASSWLPRGWAARAVLEVRAAAARDPRIQQPAPAAARPVFRGRHGAALAERSAHREATGWRRCRGASGRAFCGDGAAGHLLGGRRQADASP